MASCRRFDHLHGEGFRAADHQLLGKSNAPSSRAIRATITATAVSPQNRPLTYSYTATAGTVTPSGSTATYNSAGAPSGTVDVTCNVADDKGHTATATATLTILPPPPPPGPSPEQIRLEARLALHSVFFPTAQPRATHPEGGLVTASSKP